MDAVAEGGSGLRVVKTRLRRLDGKNELAEAGREGRTRLTKPNSQARTGTGQKTHFPCSVDYKLDWQPHWLMSSLLNVITIRVRKP